MSGVLVKVQYLNVEDRKYKLPRKYLLIHPLSHLSCNHHQLGSSNKYITKLVSGICEATYYVIADENRMLQFCRQYDESLMNLKPISLCHSCCVELIIPHHLHKLLNIITFKNTAPCNYDQYTLTHYTGMAITGDYRKIHSTIIKDSSNNFILYPIEIMIDIIRTILSFPDIAIFIFKYRPIVWKSILRFWRTVCLRFSTHINLAVINDTSDLNLNNNEMLNYQRKSREIIASFSSTIMSTIRLWKA
eukprot:294113_1